MTSFEMDAMLKSIRVKRNGGRLLISGRAFVDGEIAGFMVSRKIPVEQTPKFPSVKMLWFDELSNFDTKGGAK